MSMLTFHLLLLASMTKSLSLTQESHLLGMLIGWNLTAVDRMAVARSKDRACMERKQENQPGGSFNGPEKR